MEQDGKMFNKNFLEVGPILDQFILFGSAVGLTVLLVCGGHSAERSWTRWDGWTRH